MSYLANINSLLKIPVIAFNEIKHKTVFALTLIFAAATAVVSILHYQGKLTINDTLWSFWLLSISGIIVTFLPKTDNIINYWRYSNHKTNYWVFICVSILFCLVRLFYYSTSPWNNYGLFDDAAWDINFAKEWILFSDGSFQPAFCDAIICKESIFYYYNIALFELFGYNLFTFNMGLAFLGFVTVLFTTLTIHKLFNRSLITCIGAIIILTFPLHVTQTFMGHRYAIALPLIMISYYYLVCGFKNNSALQVALGGIFAGLSANGAHMGKQYILAMLATIPLLIFFYRKDKSLLDKKAPLACISISSLVIVLVPLICFVYFNSFKYFNREKDLIAHGFFGEYRIHGISVIVPHLEAVANMFFAPLSGYRRFMLDYPLIPYAYLLLLFPGLLIAIFKKRWEVFVMCLLPAFICILTEGFDFRVQISTPFWIIAMLYVLNAFMPDSNKRSPRLNYVCMGGVILCIAIGVVSSTRYIIHVGESPNSIHYLKHTDVAFSRVAQDLILGNETNPSIAIKRDEFNLAYNPDKINYNVLSCPYFEFGIVYLYFQNFGETLVSRNIISLCNGEPVDVYNSNQVLKQNIDALKRYKNNGKDLMLVWEVGDVTIPVINAFSKFKDYGYIKEYSYTIDGITLKVTALKINKDHVDNFIKQAELLRI
jgi:hypothetical protein